MYLRRFISTVPWNVFEGIRCYMLPKIRGSYVHHRFKYTLTPPVLPQP